MQHAEINIVRLQIILDVIMVMLMEIYRIPQKCLKI